LITCHEAFASAYPDGRVVRVTTDPERTEAEFARCSAFDHEGWRSLVSIYRRVAPHVLPFTNMALPSGEAALQALRMAAGLRAAMLDLRHVIFGRQANWSTGSSAPMKPKALSFRGASIRILGRPSGRSSFRFHRCARRI
jgi:phytoene dehydrogenase-like protein